MSGGSIFFSLLVAFAVYYLAGCLIGAWLDDDEGTLIAWVRTAPGGSLIGIMAWPWWVVPIWKCRREMREYVEGRRTFAEMQEFTRRQDERYPVDKAGE